MTMGNGNGGERPSPKKTLTCGTFSARTVRFFTLQFTAAKDGSKRDRLGIEVEFTEGPNIGMHGTGIFSSDSMEFFLNTIIACGWAQGMNPTDIPVGVEVKAVVATDTNPNTNETNNVVKYINSMAGRKSALAEKYGMDEKGTKDWNSAFQASMAAFVKTSGFEVPKAGAKPMATPTTPAPQGAPGPAGSGGGSAVDDDVPFMRLADI